MASSCGSGGPLPSFLELHPPYPTTLSTARWSDFRLPHGSGIASVLFLQDQSPLPKRQGVCNGLTNTHLQSGLFRGAGQAQSVERATLDLGVVGGSLPLAV